jgi:hypothetical protein
MQRGIIDHGFIRMIKYIGNKNNGWFVPVSNISDFINQRKIEKNLSEYIPDTFKKKIELHSLMTRIKYRYFVKIDDYHFKKSKSYEK